MKDGATSPAPAGDRPRLARRSFDGPLAGAILGMVLAAGAAGPGWAGETRSTPAPPMTTHRFSVDDVYGLQQVVSASAVSPRGDQVALVIKAPIASNPGRAGLFNNDRADIWLYDRPSRRLTRLAPALPGEDRWYPVWSPDGARLAFLATSALGGERPQVRIWSRATGRIEQMPVAADVNNDINVHARPLELIWLDGEDLALRALPMGAEPIMTRSPRASMNVATALHAEAVRGLQPTAMRFDTRGATHPQLSLTSDPLVICRVAARTCRTIGEVSSAHEFSADDGHPVLIPAPDSDLIAAIAASDRTPGDGSRRRLRWSTNGLRLKVFSRDGEIAADVLAKIRAVAPGSVRWGRNAHELMFLGSEDPRTGMYQDNQADWRLYSLDARRGVLRLIDLQGLAPIPPLTLPAVPDAFPDVRLQVLDPETALVFAPGSDAGWWVVGPQGRRRLACADPGARLSADGASLFCAGEALTRIAVADGAAQTLVPKGTERLRLLADESADQGVRAGGHLVVSATATDGRVRHDLLNAVTGAIERLATPERDVELAAFSEPASLGVFVEEGDNGSRVLMAKTAGAAPEVAFAANREALERVQGGRAYSFDYATADGQPLKAWVLLPPDYQPGRRYPTVVWVYEGARFGARTPEVMRKSMINPLNLQSYAAHGYVVLMPSMPGRFESYQDLLIGVDPAIDALVAQGVADPRRLAVAGQSNGGFSTYGIVSQSRRFKAAIAMAGMTDFQSISLLFEQPLLPRRQIEGASGRLQLYEIWMNYDLPWRDRRYLDNSPIAHVEDVHAPVLLIHGDYDGAPIEQADEFYSALERLGKPARYLRYFGDDHVLYSPANVRDSWAEIFEWLREYLGPEPAQPNP